MPAEREVAGGAERGAWTDVGKIPPADLGGKREGLGIKMGGRGCGSLRSQGTRGRAEEGAGLGDGRARMESREGRRAGGAGRVDMSTGRCDEDGLGCRLQGATKFRAVGTLVTSTTYGVAFTIYGGLAGDKDLLGRYVDQLWSAARSRERNERSSVVASGELANGFVNWGRERRPSEGADMSEGLESALVGSDDLRN